MVCVLTLYCYIIHYCFSTDQVEKVVHETSTNNDEMEELDDIDMADETVSESKKPRKKREKKIIPVGRNGLKKKRVTKTKKTIDDNGYMRKYFCFNYIYIY